MRLQAFYVVWLAASQGRVRHDRLLCSAEHSAVFAGIPVTDYTAALPWYERFFGGPPAFLPNDTEAVWEVAAHRFVYIVRQPGRAGNALVLSFVEDLDERVAGIAQRGIEPAGRETYGSVVKVTYRDADSNEISLGGSPG